MTNPNKSTLGQKSLTGIGNLAPAAQPTSPPSTKPAGPPVADVAGESNGD